MVYMLHSAEIFPDPEFAFTILRRSPQPPFPYHAHDFTELVIVLSGKGVHYTEDDAYDIAMGDVFVIQASQPHGFRETQALSLVNVIFQPSRLNLPWEEMGQLPGYHALFTFEPIYRKQHTFRSRLHLDADELAHTTTLLAQIEAETAHRTPGYEAMVLAHSTELIVMLARAYARMATPTSHAMLRMGTVLSTIQSQYAERWDLDSLAAIANLSPSHFIRVFREATGMPPLDYLIHFRIHKAMELLRNPHWTIAEVADQVGFSDSNYFSRQFKTIVGCAPRAYRERVISPVHMDVTASLAGEIKFPQGK